MSTRNRIGLILQSASRQRASIRLLKLTVTFLLVAAAAHWVHVATPGEAAQNEGAVVAGVVSDDKASPVVDAKVTIASGDFFASVRTQADGKYEFRNLKPGQYKITADATSFRKQSVTVTVTRPDESLAAPILKLSASSLHVKVGDANNQALRGVSVSLSSQERGVASSMVARVTTDDGGDAYFGKLAQGSYQLNVVQRGFDEYRNQVSISSGMTNELAVQLSVAPVIPINEKAVLRRSVPNLPSKNVQAIFQDSEGWMWFGTDKGVARFNGADFESSAVSGSAYEELAGEDIRSIAEDSSGAIWLATPRGARRISKSGVGISGGLEGRDARHVYASPAGKVWVSTADGLVRFDGRTSVQIDQSTGLPSSDVRAVAEDKSGKLWVATARGLATIEGERVAFFNQPVTSSNAIEARPATQDSRPHTASESPAAGPPSTARSLDGSDVRFIFVDNRGALWIATSAGVYVFDGTTLRAVRSPALDAGGDSSVRAIGQDRKDRIWFALGAGGALLYDPGRREWQRVGSLDRNRVAAVFTGSEGITWFGTDNGAVRADLYSFVSFNASRGLADNDVRAVVEIPASGRDRGKLWFVTGSGISQMEGERFVPVDRFRANTSVRAIAFDDEGSYWLATEQGALKLSGQTITQFSEGNGLEANNVHFVAVLADGSSVVFATSKGANIYKRGEIKRLEALSGYDVRHVFEDADGKLWFSTARGVVRIDPGTNASEVVDSGRGLADNDTRCITRFKDQLLIATRAGVQVYREERRGGWALGTFDGEPASTLFVDRDGFLWVGTDDGQVKKFASIGGHSISAIYSGETYALTGNRVNSISEDSAGQIWISTDKGAVRHLPMRQAPPTQISLRADGQTERAYGSGPHALPYGGQRLTFYFTAASMTGQVRYLYRINPANASEPWTLLAVQPGATREVTLFGIGAGEQAFEVIALNRDLYGAGSEIGGAALTPAAVLVVRVAPPFWTSWWFYLTGLALISLTLAGILAVRKLRDREYDLPKELRSYVPIEPNPYIVGNPIRTESMFFGREDDFRYVRTKLEGVSQGVVIVFCGERRVGKSSILYQVLNGRLGDRFVPVFVDMQEMVISSDSEFFARISRLIAEAVSAALGPRPAALPSAADARAEPANIAMGGSARAVSRRAGPLVSVPQFDGRNPYPLFLDFLDEVLAALDTRTLLILIDEYELMEAKVDEGKLSPDLFTFLAGLMDNKERLALIFTGSRRLEERDKKYWRELLRRSLFRKVGFLSEKDAARLISEPVAGRVVYGRGVADVIYRLTAGQPFYAQVTCQNVVDYMNEHQQNWITLADLQHVIADIVDNPLPQMIYAWDGLSDDEKLVLSLMGEQLSDGNLFTTASELRASVRANDYPVNLSENTIRLTLEEMFRRELIEKDAKDGFRFKIDLLRLWIRRSHSIWQVVKEVRTL
ncbi:MAG TPA: two-component regulator propeller domain-containing protein [Blastocatellia bacterium]|nr:two-component regulator propeller domain-containing protein [Blastocatellia bacterium]